MKEKFNITVAGTGYVGLSISVLLAQNNNVTALDLIQEKVDLINQKKSPIQDKEISEFEEVITSPLMQQIFKQPTSRCSCKEQTSEPQKCVKNDEQKRTSRYQERTPRVKVNVDELDEAAIDRLISDFVRTLL